MAFLRTDNPEDEVFRGVVTRTCNYKYGFIRCSAELPNLFFHFSELSDENKALVGCGVQVSFRIQKNTWADNKMKAISISVFGEPDENAFKNLHGTIQNNMRSRGFCFIDADDSNTYLFHSSNLVQDDASRANGDTVFAGQRITFDANWNHKYSPPKPYATNVRLHPGQMRPRPGPYHLSDRETFGSSHSSSRPSVDFDRSTFGSSNMSDHSLFGSKCSFRSSIGESNTSRGHCSASRVSDRASALRDGQRWGMRTTTGMRDLHGVECSSYGSFSSFSSNACGGLRMSNRLCKFGRRCTRVDCWFEHPQGRCIEDKQPWQVPAMDIISRKANANTRRGAAVGPVLRDGAARSSSNKNSGTTITQSMGRASLKLLVKALVDEGKCSYLAMRNSLQSSQYIGRELMPDEKASVGELLLELVPCIDKEKRNRADTILDSNDEERIKSATLGDETEGQHRSENHQDPPAAQKPEPEKQQQQAQDVRKEGGAETTDEETTSSTGEFDFPTFESILQEEKEREALGNVSKICISMNSINRPKVTAIDP